MKRTLAVVGLALALAGCAGALQWNPPGAAPPAVPRPPATAAEVLPAHYTVKAGDTLYSIAWRYGLDYHDLVAWNGIGSDYLIKPGQKLALSAPERAAPTSVTVSRPAPAVPVAAPPRPTYTPAAGPLRWVWPARGRIVRMFRAGDPLSKGLDISGVEGEDVRAAAAGKVVYTGSGIIGYGKLIIIKNSEEFLSAYADNGEILVKEDDVVQAGERIATMGLGRNGRPLLHFEIRYNGKPVNPQAYLPSH